jgi:hypothetical protein
MTWCKHHQYVCTGPQQVLKYQVWTLFYSLETQQCCVTPSWHVPITALTHSTFTFCYHRTYLYLKTVQWTARWHYTDYIRCACNWKHTCEMACWSSEFTIINTDSWDTAVIRWWSTNVFVFLQNLWYICAKSSQNTHLKLLLFSSRNYNICIDKNSVPQCTLNLYNQMRYKGYRKYPRIPEPIFPFKEALLKWNYLSCI